MQQYLDLLQKVKNKGKLKKSRTGTDTFSISGAMFEHDMCDGFPLLTTKRMGMRDVAKELDFFIQGRSDKTWLQEHGCHIWDGWANPQKVAYGNDEITKFHMREEPDLGRIYGVQWRNWRGAKVAPDGTISLVHIDQLKNAIDTLRTDPTSRRLLVEAWNPADLDEMALPPCHYGFQLLSDGDTLDLLWSQRSVDTPLGLPYNLASYALLLKLIAASVGQVAGKLIGFLADVHIYRDQMEGVEEQLTRSPLKLPELLLPQSFSDVLRWDYKQFALEGYQHLLKITFPLSI